MSSKPSARQLDREVAAFLAQKPRLSSSRGLSWRALGSEGDPWPAWLREYKSACGVYAIRSGGTVLYVGSSKKRLYDTITRHFQQWKRKKKWWKGAYGAGHDPGLVYQRGRCEAAIATCACGAELEEEARWIERLQPRDNLVESPDGGDRIPF